MSANQERGIAEYSALVNAMSHTQPACANDPRFILEPAQLDDANKTALKVICRWCPLADRCGAYARKARPSGGFWAGRYWGRIERSDQ